MKRLITVLLISIATVSCSRQLPDTQTTIGALTEIEQKLARAWVDRDRETINNILADDWSVIDPSGRVLTKQQVLGETFASADRKIESLTIDEVKVRSLGRLAVVTGRTTAAGSYQEKRSEVVLRFTDVFEQRNGRWQVVASQGTVVAP